MAAVVVAVLVSAGVQLVVGRLPIPAGTNVGLALTATGGVLVAVLLAASGLLARRHPAVAAPAAWAGLSALATLPVALLLSGTRHYVFGVSGDQSFRVEYLTRFADAGRLADVAYADLPPYYPAGWFWVGGRLARLLGVDAWAFYKPYAITTMAVTAVLALLLWSRVTTPARALGYATATTLAGLALAVYTPYSWLTAALVPPVSVLAVRLAGGVAASAPVRGATDPADTTVPAGTAAATGPIPPADAGWPRAEAGPPGAGGRFRAGDAVITGLVLGAAAVTHTQIAFFALFVLGVLTPAALVRSRGRAAGRLLGAAGIVAVAALPPVLVFWTPYLLARLGGATGTDAAQRFLPQSGALYPLPMLQPTALGALTLAGTVWIVLRFRDDAVARGLGAVVACGYAWYLLSTLALVAHTTLLSFRIEPVLTAALACGAAGLAADGIRAVPSRVAPRLPALVAVLAAVAVVAQVQTTPETYSWSRAAQTGDRYPDGSTPSGGAPDTGADELAATIDGLTGRPEDQVVVLSTTYALLTYRPYRTWLTTIAQYSNPLADFAARRDRVLAWAGARTPAELLAALDTSPARPPSVFVFQRGADGLLRIGLTYDPFPAQTPGSATAVFDPRLFDDPAFARRDVGGYTVVVRTG